MDETKIMTLREKIAENYYNNTGIPYLGPRSTYARTYTEEHIADFVGTKAQISDREDELMLEAEKYWKEQNELRIQKSAQLTLEFKRDLFEENGVVGNPKAEKAYEIAKRLSDEGLRGIMDVFETIVELIK